MEQKILVSITNLGTGFDSYIYYIKIQSDGKILVGGLFSTLNGNTRNRLVRLNSNGTVDTSFYTNFRYWICNRCSMAYRDTI